MNFLKETTEAIGESGHYVDDVIFIGSERSGHQCTWGEFQALANFEYSDGFVSSGIATDLVVVFSDGSRLWRGECDGSEWWNFSSPFVRPQESKRIAHLGGDAFFRDTLAGINEEETKS